MKLTFKVKETMGLKDYLIKYYSFSFFGYLRQSKACVLANKQKISFNDRVDVQDIIEIDYHPIEQDYHPVNKPIRIIYEDDDCLVIDKEAGLTCIPSRLHYDDSLFNRLQYYFRNQEVTLHFISRLDKDTSGLVLVCKNQHSACLFSKASSSFVKEYQAETTSPLPKEHDIISFPIKRISGMKRGVDQQGKPAQSEYQFINEEKGIYRYLVRIYTGVTHQIRVHLSHLGSPIINDPIYNSKTADGRMHLHACYLKFYHPIKEKWIELNSIPNFYNSKM